MSDGRDQSVERLLRRSLRAQGDASEGLCPDAETLAAWADGGLSGNERAAAETHLSHCARCQMTLAAFVRGDVPEQVAHDQSWRRWGLGLLVPLAAGAAAVAIWIAVPQPTPTSSAPAQVRQPPASDPRVSSGVSPADPTPAAPAAAANGELTVAFDREKQRERLSRLSQAAASADVAKRVMQPTTAAGSAASPPGPAAASPPAAPTAAAETMAGARALMRSLEAAPTVIASPDAGALWRFGGGGALQYSSTAGRQWETLQVDVNVELTAGASPSASVCWLVGRAGTVLRTIDGRRFQRVPFPEAVDLTSVTSASDRAAIVTTSDGRVFRTADGGVTWN